MDVFHCKCLNQFLPSDFALCVFNPNRLWPLDFMGDSVQVQLGCDGLERGVSGRQLHALLLPPVQTKASELKQHRVRSASVHGFMLIKMQFLSASFMTVISPAL